MRVTTLNVTLLILLAFSFVLSRPGQAVWGAEESAAPLSISRTDPHGNSASPFSLPLMEGADGVQKQGKEGPVLPNLYSSAVRMVAVLGVMVGGLFALFYFTRPLLRRAGAIGGKEKVIRIIANNYVGGKKVISLISVADNLLVVGITPTNISMLTRIDDPETIEKFKPPKGHNHPSASFMSQLKKFSRKSEGGEDVSTTEHDI